MTTVVIASHNPVKMQATRQAFQAMFPAQPFSFASISVPSGVRAQPFSDEETLQGATNRAHGARQAQPDAHIWVGLEGGVEVQGETLWSFAWAVVLTSTSIGQGKTGTIQLPQRVATLVQHGMELGEADDIVFQRQNSKHAEGAVGLLTGGLIDRAAFYRDALIFALVPLKNPTLYPDEHAAMGQKCL